MTNMDQGASRAIFECLEAINRLHGQYIATIQSAPPPGSRATELLADELGERAHNIAAAHISSALDHALTMKRIVDTEWVPAYALFSLARTAHEGALNALWLLEPGLTLDDQIARGVGAQYSDYCEREKLEVAIRSRAEGERKLAVDRRADYMDNAHRRGFAKLSSNADLVPTRALLSAVDLFNLFETQVDADGHQIPGSAHYRFYSAFAHAKQWAIMLGDLDVTPPFDEHGTRLFSLTASDHALVNAYLRPTAAVRRALAAFVAIRSTG